MQRPAFAVPTYLYYCPSYGAYYPYVSSCSESWVPVPASWRWCTQPTTTQRATCEALMKVDEAGGEW